jgi:hypothetical protein
MFGYLQAFGQIKSASKVQGLGQIMDNEVLRIDLQLAPVYIISIHADDIMDGLYLPFPQPCAASATDINDTSYRKNRPHD